MSAEITLFENAEFGSVRGLLRNGEPWFVAKDVCDCLEIRTDTVRAILDEDEVATTNPNTIGVPSGGRDMLLVSEPGLYSLILRSRKPEAKEFKRWVTHEVLPSIRKTGQYSLTPKSYIEALRKLADEVEAHEATRCALAIEQERHEYTKETLHLTEEQRDKAIREKAWIGTHREASAMGTASAATKRANNWKRSAGELADVAETQRNEIDGLNDQLGRGYTWMTVKAIPWLLTMFKPSRQMWSAVGKALVKHSKELGMPPHEAPHAEFGTVKSYHIDVIDSFRRKLTADPKMLWRYRRHHEH